MNVRPWKRCLSALLALGLLSLSACGGTAEKTELPPAEESAAETDDVPPISGLREDFICGMDVSSYLSEIASGVTFYDFAGNALDEQGFFRFLASECGVNYIRIRIWNDPYDEDGNPYGGGNCDLEHAVTLGRLATDAGMRVLIDFHYSDFWADPGKQTAPKAWSDDTVAEKADAIGAYTADALETLLASGVDVGMVQIGNETTAGLCGEWAWPNITLLMQAASESVRSVADAFGREIKIAVHFTNPEQGNYNFYARTLEQAGVDYDVFASSYYPYWHGTTENLTRQLSNVAETYGKEVMVAETSYIYTCLDGDGHGNSVGSGSSSLDYDVSPQGQADAVRAVVSAVSDVGASGIGVFYWEPAWIPVHPVVLEEDLASGKTNVSADPAAYGENQAAWEQYGCGWASSFAGGYDEGARQYYGGSAVDNGALFDFWGHPLPSASVFQEIQAES